MTCQISMQYMKPRQKSLGKIEIKSEDAAVEFVQDKRVSVAGQNAIDSANDRVKKGQDEQGCKRSKRIAERMGFVRDEGLCPLSRDRLVEMAVLCVGGRRG